MQQSVGLDLVEVARFLPMAEDRNHLFLKKVFAETEVEYCFAHANPAEHLAGHFAAKEAASKALGVTEYPFIEIEVRHASSGAPELWHKGVLLPVSVSISHTSTMAAAVVIK
jgi:holo-[acyl-carrier protein] synthase